MSARWRIGLTGGMGSGKTTVAGMLQALGATVVDADALARELTAPGGGALPAIRQAFGDAVIDPQGALDRQAMRQMAFADADARRRLEGIVHPLVRQLTRERAAQALAGGQRWLVFDVPLLVESEHWRRDVDQVWVVDCLPETQMARVMARSGLDRAAVQAVLAAQSSRQRRLQAADAVLFNEGLSLGALQREVSLLASAFGLSSSPMPVQPHTAA